MRNLYRTAIVVAAMVVVVTLAVMPGFAQTSNAQSLAQSRIKPVARS